MKVAVSSRGRGLDSDIDPRFGRCTYFLIAETDDMSFEVFENENVSLGSDASIQSAHFVVSKGIKAVITGNWDPIVVQTLTSAGISLFVDQTGTVKEALEKCRNGELKPTAVPDVPDLYGVADREYPGEISDYFSYDEIERELPMCCEMGCGTGMDGRRDVGFGMRRPGWDDSNQNRKDSLSYEEELRFLKKHSADLNKQMEEIQERIRRLEEK